MGTRTDFPEDQDWHDPGDYERLKQALSDVAEMQKRIDKLERVVEEARPFVRALELVQVCLPDHEIEDVWSKELALQQALKELYGEHE